MTLYFNNSNYIENVNVETQEFFEYNQNEQKMIIYNASKINIHMCGAGGGGGYGYGGGGGSGFTILDFPYYPFKNNIIIKVQVGKGGKGGYKMNMQSYPAEKGGETIVNICEGENNILKEFICYGGEPGEDYFDITYNSSYVYQFKKGGNGGMNTKKNQALMNAYYVNQSTSTLGRPEGGNTNNTNGSDARIYYLGVSGAGGGANLGFYKRDNENNKKISNNGGSFILNEGGKGYIYSATSTDFNIGGGGGSSYFGKGGNGGTYITNANGSNAEANSGAGGGGGSIINRGNNILIGNGGDGGDGGVIIEVIGGKYKIY